MSEKIQLTRDLTIELEESTEYGEVVPKPIKGYIFVDSQEGAEHRSYTDWELIIRRLSDSQLFASEPYKIDSGPYGDHDYWRDQKTVEFHAVVARPKVTTVIEYVSADKVPAPEPEPDPSDPRQIAVSLMLDAARNLDTANVWDVVMTHHPDMSDLECALKIQKICELAETADITIGWADEVTP